MLSVLLSALVLQMGAGPPDYSVRLPDGTSLRLVSIHAAGGKAWSPDGTILRGQRPLIDPSGELPPPPGKQARTLRVELIRRKGGPVPDVRFPKPYLARAVSSATSADGQVSEETIEATAHVKANRTPISLRFGVATGSWRRRVQVPFKRARDIFTGDRLQLFAVEADVSRIVGSDDFGVFGTTSEGKTLGAAATTGRRGKTAQTFQFVTPKPIVKLEVRTRPYTWVDFKSVRLYPQKR